MKTYTTLSEAFKAIDYGMCSICEAEHEFPNVKCDLMHWSGGDDGSGVCHMCEGCPNCTEEGGE